MKTPSVNIVKASSILEDWNLLRSNKIQRYGFARPDALIDTAATNNLEKTVIDAEAKLKAEEALNKAYAYGPTALIEPSVEFTPAVEYFKY